MHIANIGSDPAVEAPMSCVLDPYPNPNPKVDGAVALVWRFAIRGGPAFLRVRELLRRDLPLGVCV